MIMDTHLKEALNMSIVKYDTSFVMQKRLRIFDCVKSVALIYP